MFRFYWNRNLAAPTDWIIYIIETSKTFLPSNADGATRKAEERWSPHGDHLCYWRFFHRSIVSQLYICERPVLPPSMCMCIQEALKMPQFGKYFFQFPLFPVNSYVDESCRLMLSLILLLINCFCLTRNLLAPMPICEIRYYFHFPVFFFSWARWFFANSSVSYFRRSSKFWSSSVLSK